MGLLLRDYMLGEKGGRGLCINVCVRKRGK